MAGYACILRDSTILAEAGPEKEELSKVVVEAAAGIPKVASRMSMSHGQSFVLFQRDRVHADVIHCLKGTSLMRRDEARCVLNLLPILFWDWVEKAGGSTVASLVENQDLLASLGVALADSLAPFQRKLPEQQPEVSEPEKRSSSTPRTWMGAPLLYPKNHFRRGKEKPTVEDVLEEEDEAADLAWEQEEKRRRKERNALLRSKSGVTDIVVPVGFSTGAVSSPFGTGSPLTVRAPLPQKQAEEGISFQGSSPAASPEAQGQLDVLMEDISSAVLDKARAAAPSRFATEGTLKPDLKGSVEVGGRASCGEQCSPAPAFMGLEGHPTTAAAAAAAAAAEEGGSSADNFPTKKSSSSLRARVLRPTFTDSPERASPGTPLFVGLPRWHDMGADSPKKVLGSLVKGAAIVDSPSSAGAGSPGVLVPLWLADVRPKLRRDASVDAAQDSSRQGVDSAGRCAAPEEVARGLRKSVSVGMPDIPSGSGLGESKPGLSAAGLVHGGTEAQRPQEDRVLARKPSPRELLALEIGLLEQGDMAPPLSAASSTTSAAASASWTGPEAASAACPVPALGSSAGAVVELGAEVLPTPMMLSPSSTGPGCASVPVLSRENSEVESQHRGGASEDRRERKGGPKLPKFGRPNLLSKNSGLGRLFLKRSSTAGAEREEKELVGCASEPPRPTARESMSVNVTSTPKSTPLGSTNGVLQSAGGSVLKAAVEKLHSPLGVADAEVVASGFETVTSWTNLAAAAEGSTPSSSGNEADQGDASAGWNSLAIGKSGPVRGAGYELAGDVVDQGSSSCRRKSFSLLSPRNSRTALSVFGRAQASAEAKIHSAFPDLATDSNREATPRAPTLGEATVTRGGLGGSSTSRFPDLEDGKISCTGAFGLRLAPNVPEYLPASELELGGVTRKVNSDKERQRVLRDEVLEWQAYLHCGKEKPLGEGLLQNLVERPKELPTYSPWEVSNSPVEPKAVHDEAGQRVAGGLGGSGIAAGNGGGTKTQQEKKAFSHLTEASSCQGPGPSGTMASPLLAFGKCQAKANQGARKSFTGAISARPLEETHEGPAGSLAIEWNGPETPQPAAAAVAEARPARAGVGHDGARNFAFVKLGGPRTPTPASPATGKESAPRRSSFTILRSSSIVDPHGAGAAAAASAEEPRRRRSFIVARAELLGGVLDAGKDSEAEALGVLGGDPHEDPEEETVIDMSLVIPGGDDEDDVYNKRYQSLPYGTPKASKETGKGQGLTGLIRRGSAALRMFDRGPSNKEKAAVS